MRAPRRAALALVVAAALGACGQGGTAVQDTGAGAGAGADARPGTAASPLAGRRLYVDPEGNGPTAVRALREQGRAAQADALAPIAERPTAVWVGHEVTDPYAAMERLTTAAAARGEVPVVTVYDLPERDCGQYSSGGAAGPDAYLQWLGSLAAGFGEREVVVVLEPDAVPHAVEGCAGSVPPQERYALLSAAVDVLVRQPGVRVYVDAGHADWVEDLDALAAALRASGVQRAAGFALNVSNFQPTEDTVGYGRALSDRLDGAHFVIDTSRNGRGAPPAASGSERSWCNPPGRALGTPPTTDTGEERVDALLWVKQPGDSDGECRPGAPPAGQWWPALAADLVGAS